MGASTRHESRLCFERCSSGYVFTRPLIMMSRTCQCVSSSNLSVNNAIFLQQCHFVGQTFLKIGMGVHQPLSMYKYNRKNLISLRIAILNHMSFSSYSFNCLCYSIYTIRFFTLLFHKPAVTCDLRTSSESASLFGLVNRVLQYAYHTSAMLTRLIIILPSLSLQLSGNILLWDSRRLAS